MDNGLYSFPEGQVTYIIEFKSCKENIAHEAHIIQLNVSQIKVPSLVTQSKLFQTDKIIMKHGHRCLSLSPYYHLSLVELVWTKVEGYMAAGNKTFNLCDV